MSRCLITGEQFEQVIVDLVAYVHRITTDEKATPAEIAALPEIAKILLLLDPD